MTQDLVRVAAPSVLPPDTVFGAFYHSVVSRLPEGRATTNQGAVVWTSHVVDAMLYDGFWPLVLAVGKRIGLAIDSPAAVQTALERIDRVLAVGLEVRYGSPEAAADAFLRELRGRAGAELQEKLERELPAVYAALLVSSLVRRWPYDLTPTLKHYAFDTVGGYAPLLNSVYVASLTAVVGTVLTFAGAYAVEKCRTIASGPLYLLSILPVAIPGMVLGLAYIFTFNAPGSALNRLYGTMAILVISNVIHYFTVGFLTATTSLKQLDAEFENVSASLGVPFYKTFWRVTVPISLPSIIAISMYFFLNGMVTLSAVIFLVAPGTELAAVAVLLMDDAGDTAQAAAMSVLIIGIGLAVRFLYWLVLRGVTRRTQAWVQPAPEQAEAAEAKIPA